MPHTLATQHLSLSPNTQLMIPSPSTPPLSLSYHSPLFCVYITQVFLSPLDFFLENLPDDLLVTSIDLPALDGPTDLPPIPPSLAPSSSSSQLGGLNSTHPNSSQTHAPSVSPLGQPLTQQHSPATSVSPAPKATPPPSTTPSGGGPLVTGAGLTTSAAAVPPNATIVSTSGDPTPALPNVSSTSASPYPNVATPPSSVPMAMGTHARMPYISYSGGMPSSVAPAINSQMTQGGMQQAGMGGYSLRHPAPSPGVMQGQMVHSPNMMSNQHRMMQMRHRPMMHPVHGGHAMMGGHPQQSMGMHHPHMAIHRGAQQMGGVNMAGGGMMQNAGGIHMNPNLHMQYDPRSRMAIVGKPGMHHARMVSPHHVQQHPGMHVQRHQNMIMGGHPHQYMDPSGYQGHMQGYSMVPRQNAMIAPSSQMMPHTQPMIAQQAPSPNPQQNQPPAESNSLPGQLGGAPSPQLQVATPPQQQATPPQQQATPPQQQTPGAAPLTVS